MEASRINRSPHHSDILTRPYTSENRQMAEARYLGFYL